MVGGGFFLFFWQRAWFDTWNATECGLILWVDETAWHKSNGVRKQLDKRVIKGSGRNGETREDSARGQETSRRRGVVLMGRAVNCRRLLSTGHWRCWNLASRSWQKGCRHDKRAMYRLGTMEPAHLPNEEGVLISWVPGGLLIEPYHKKVWLCAGDLKLLVFVVGFTPETKACV